MGFGVAFDEPYLETIPADTPPSGIPDYWHVLIGDHTYVVDTEFKPYLRDATRHRSTPAQRQAIDLTNIPGEGTVNPEGLWRRGAIDWSLGAGQLFLDRKDSGANRFYQSKGVDVLTTKWQAQLLPDTNQIYEATGGVQCIGVGSLIYVLDFALNQLFYDSGGGSWTAVTGTPSGMQYIATDGNAVYIACGSNGIYETVGGTTSAIQIVTGTVNIVAWVADRLMAAAGPNLYNVIFGGALPPPLLIHPNSGWTWSCFAEGSGQIYIGGYDPAGEPSARHKSGIYRTTIESTGTALQVPVLSLPLEGSEYVTALFGYINFVFVGTNLGMRMCRTLSAYDPSGNAGDLEAGPLVPNLLQPVTAPVFGITGDNRFVYFGWTNYDADSTGIGRCDLSTFIDTLAPVYCSDLMCEGAGTVSWLDFGPFGQILISVDGVGVFTKAGTFVDSGYIDSGYVEYDIPDDKIAVAGLMAIEQPVQGSVSMSIGVDQGTIAEVALQPGGSPSISPFPVAQLRGGLFMVRTSLMSDSGGGNSPVLFRWMLKAIPAVVAGTVISVVLILHKAVTVQDGDQWQDPYAELAYLENLRQTQEIVRYQEGPYTAQVTVDEIDWLPFKLQDTPEGGYDADCVVYLKTWTPRG